MKELTSLLWEKIKHNNASETACLASQKES